jgi:peptidoglycan/LPS O-acetylase OafA/YrhL
LITSIIVTELEEGRFVYSSFYYRRAKRILPALFVVMASTVPFAWFWMLPEQHNSYLDSLVYVSLFVSNFLFWKESGYFAPSAEEKPLLHTWSLAVEEQYYLLFPLLIVGLWRFGRNPVLATIVLLSCLSLWLSQWGSEHKPEANFYLLVSRAWEIFAGAIAALLMLKKQPQGNGLLAFVGLLCILISVFTYNESTPIPSFYALLPVVGTVLMLVYAQSNTLVAKVLSLGPLVYIGLISYSLYLWHQPILAFARLKGLQLDNDWLLLSLLGLTLLLAMGTYKFVEVPIKQSPFYASKGRLFAVVFGVLVIFIGYGNVASNSNYFTLKYPTAATLLEQTKWPAQLSYSKECRLKYGADQYCLITDIQHAPTAALIGDSHANHFYWGLSEYVEKKGGNLLLLGAGACPPFVGANRGFHPEHGYLRCFNRTDKLYQSVIDNPVIKEVYIAFRGDEYFRDDVAMNDVYGEITGGSNLTKSVLFLRRTISLLQAEGKKVVLISDLPDLPMSLETCIKNDYVLQQGTGCLDFPLNPISSAYTALMSAMAMIKGLVIFPTYSLTNDQFPSGDAGLTYRDSTHLSYKGSMYFGPMYKQYFDDL